MTVVYPVTRRDPLAEGVEAVSCFPLFIHAVFFLVITMEIGQDRVEDFALAAKYGIP